MQFGEEQANNLGETLRLWSSLTPSPPSFAGLIAPQSEKNPANVVRQLPSNWQAEISIPAISTPLQPVRVLPPSESLPASPRSKASIPPRPVVHPPPEQPAPIPPTLVAPLLQRSNWRALVGIAVVIVVLATLYWMLRPSTTPVIRPESTNSTVNGTVTSTPPMMKPPVIMPSRVTPIPPTSSASPTPPALPASPPPSPETVTVVTPTKVPKSAAQPSAGGVTTGLTKSVPRPANNTGHLIVKLSPPAKARLDGFQDPDDGNQAASIQRFSNLEKRTYRLTVWKEGYRKREENINVNADDIQEIEIMLEAN